MRNAGYKIGIGLSGVALVVAFSAVFLYAPVDANLGVVQKIFYFHLPSAVTMYLSWVVCAVASVGYLATRKEKWDMVAASAGEIALVFAAILMTTGPIWGRKSWGAYWTWDPKLTAALLLTLIIVAYVVLRSLASSGGMEKKFGAALSIIGTALIPIIHISVSKWRGQHPTVVTADGGGLAPEMSTVLTMAFVAFAGLFLLLLLARYRLELNRRMLSQLNEEAAIKGLGEGGRA